MKGYKAFDKDLRCRGLQFTVGETVKHNGIVEVCGKGIHFCEKLKDVFNYYPKTEHTRVCEVEASDVIKTTDDKSATNTLTIIRELSKEEIKTFTDNFRFNSGNNNSGHYNNGNYNSGNRNSGNYNSGHYNNGDYNSGNRNSGNYNSGHYNNGNYNSGYYNSGNYNSGHYNSGNYNSGDRNSGNYNSGNYNSGNRNSGYFNTTTPKVRLFNKDTDLDFDSITLIRLRSLITPKQFLIWVSSKDMSDQEKNDNPSHQTTGGFLKKHPNEYKKQWEYSVSRMSEEDKDFIRSLPNFDADIFFEITSQRLDDTIEVTVGGKTKRISMKDAEKLGLI